MLIVQEDGRPASAIVVQALGYGLDQMALEAVRNWRFDPAKKDGKPISVEIEVETKFQLPPL
jgi:TonB family protein